MVEYREFRNADPPALVEIWQNSGRQPGLFQPVTTSLFEELIFSRLYFEREGIRIAWDGNRPLGFAHAGFGPTEDQSYFSTELGTTYQIRVRSDCENPEQVADQLLTQCEEYLVSRGAKVLYGGGIQPLNAFYWGLYGGSELPGILQGDQIARSAFESHGYKAIDHTVGFSGELRSVAPPMTRGLMQHRRKMTVHKKEDLATNSWWEASTKGCFQLSRFELQPRGGGDPLGFALVREMRFAENHWTTTPSAGLIELEIEEGHRRQGLVTYLLSEVFHDLGRHRIHQLEVQTMEHNSAAVSLYEKLGFTKADRGIVYRKS
ncbi:MAG: GNAT family N-acetyltransferase, partial [Planctomycetia bacterium]|jgi:ribosomal protein S18 acetylase RimI-like enzyme